MIWRGGIGVLSRRLDSLRTNTGFVLFARTPGHGACSPWPWAQEACQTFLGAESQYRNRLWRYRNLHSGRNHSEPEALTTSPEGLGPFTHEGSLLELSPVNGVMNAGGIARPRANFWCRPAAVQPRSANTPTPVKERAHLGGPAIPIDGDQRPAGHPSPDINPIEVHRIPAPTRLVPGRLLLALGDVPLGV
jgi:hypothetical protein